MILKSGVDEAKTICDRHQKKSIVVCKSIEHTDKLQKEIEDYAKKNNLNIHVSSMHSKSKNPLQILSDFKEDRINIILSVEMLTTGVDIPSADTLFLCRVIGSQSMWRQIIGRVLRAFEGKLFGVVIDMYDTIGYLGGHPLNRPFTSEEKENLSEGEKKTCPTCKEELSLVTIGVEILIEDMIKKVTKECSHCQAVTIKTEALEFAECEVCEGHTYIENPYSSKGFLVHDCTDCNSQIKLERIVVPQLMVAYHSREDAFKMAKTMYMAKVMKENSKISTTLVDDGISVTEDEAKKHLKEIKNFFEWTERKNILAVLDFLTEEYQVNYSRKSAIKIVDRLTVLNEEFKTDMSTRSVLIRSLITQRRTHLIEPLSIAFEQCEQIDINVPTFEELEKMTNHKKRSFDSLLKSWIKKNS